MDSLPANCSRSYTNLGNSPVIHDYANGSGSYRKQGFIATIEIIAPISDLNDPLYYDQFLEINRGENQDFALLDVERMRTIEIALLRLIPGACLEYTQLVTESMFKVLTFGSSMQRGMVFINLIDSINRIKVDMKHSLLASPEVEEQKESAVLEFTSIVMMLNDRQAFTKMDLSDVELRKLNLSDFDLGGSKFNLSGAVFRKSDRRIGDLFSTSKTLPK